MTLSADRTSSSLAAGAVRRGPAAVGMAVVFLWGLAAQLAVQGIGGRLGQFGLHHDSGRMGAFLAAALVLVVIGEGVRRSAEWARFAAIALAMLVVVMGVAAVLVLLAGHGMPRRLVFTTVVEVTFILWIAWRLSLPRTAAWFAASGRAPAGALWRDLLTGLVLYVAVVVYRLAGGGRLPLPTGRPSSLAITAVIDLAVIPVAAVLLVTRSSTAAAAAPEPAAGRARVHGPWLAALVAWSAAWGIVVALTQSIGVR
jgi:hypothetical protein